MNTQSINLKDKKNPSDLIVGDWMIIGKCIFPEIDYSIKASQVTFMENFKEKISKVQGVIGMKQQYNLDGGPNVVA